MNDDIVTSIHLANCRCELCEARAEIERLRQELTTAQTMWMVEETQKNKWRKIAGDLFNTHGHDWLHYNEHMCGEVTNGCGGYLCECGYPWSMKSGCAAAEALRMYQKAIQNG
jgi:hypothetical protein